MTRPNGPCPGSWTARRSSASMSSRRFANSVSESRRDCESAGSCSVTRRVLAAQHDATDHRIDGADHSELAQEHGDRSRSAPRSRPRTSVAQSRSTAGDLNRARSASSIRPNTKPVQCAARAPTMTPARGCWLATPETPRHVTPIMRRHMKPPTQSDPKHVCERSAHQSPASPMHSVAMAINAAASSCPDDEPVEQPQLPRSPARPGQRQAVGIEEGAS
jgi:hypothetical protein